MPELPPLPIPGIGIGTALTVAGGIKNVVQGDFKSLLFPTTGLDSLFGSGDSKRNIGFTPIRPGGNLPNIVQSQNEFILPAFKGITTGSFRDAAPFLAGAQRVLNPFADLTISRLNLLKKQTGDNSFGQAASNITDLRNQINNTSGGFANASGRNKQLFDAIVNIERQIDSISSRLSPEITKSLNLFTQTNLINREISEFDRLAVQSAGLQSANDFLDIPQIRSQAQAVTIERLNRQKQEALTQGDSITANRIQTQINAARTPVAEKPLKLDSSGTVAGGLTFGQIASRVKELNLARVLLKTGQLAGIGFGTGRTKLTSSRSVRVPQPGDPDFVGPRQEKQPPGIDKKQLARTALRAARLFIRPRRPKQPGFQTGGFVSRASSLGGSSGDIFELEKEEDRIIPSGFISKQATTENRALALNSLR